METDFIYCRHRTPIGVKIEEVSGGENRSGAVWRALALQIWKENGRDGYRDIDHLNNGAPLLVSSQERISVSHTTGLLVVATLPPTPEADLESFAERTALGIDVERRDRAQVLKVRERFLSTSELEMIPPADVCANILAWTCKEALYKAALTPGLDWREQICIDRLPVPGGATGRAHLILNGQEVKFLLYSYLSGECVVSVAITPHTATYSKKVNTQ